MNIRRVSTHRRTCFCLCVDDFAIKYYSQEDADHLLSALKEAYEITVDNQGGNFCGLRLEWDYAKGVVDVNMPHCVTKTLETKRRDDLSTHRRNRFIGHMAQKHSLRQ